MHIDIMESFAACLLSMTLLFCIVANTAQNEFNVMDYGAKADGYTDDSLAFLKAWNDTCNVEIGEPTMVIPRKMLFFIRPITFAGPCKSRVNFVLKGGIVGPKGPIEWKKYNDTVKLIEFESVSGLNINGQGFIDARGKGWWDISCKHHPSVEDCGTVAPTTIRFHRSYDVKMREIRVTNSPQIHILLLDCSDIELGYLHLQSPDVSPNTDGIHIHATNNVSIYNSYIGVGDDCVSIGDRISNVSITYVTCGPGHGISVGSLGKDGNVANVSNIHVSHVNFNGTKNGARIKTYPMGRGEVHDVDFSNINCTDVKNPIIIDQYYCDSGDCAPTDVGVHIKNVNYTEIYGTSKSVVAVNFNCSANAACTGIRLENIKLTSSSTPGTQVHATCNNAFGEAKGIMQPKSCFVGS